MYHRFHDRFGTAGVAIGVIALIAALGGTAFAAKGGLTGQQKKEVKAIAKGFQGTGPAGAPGANGTNGKDGAPGSAGAPGAPGKSVVLANSAPSSCEEGGFTYEVQGSGQKNEVCNGEEGLQGDPGPTGSPWPAGGTLPPSSAPGCPCTETGDWAVYKGAGAISVASISFTIPLAGPLDEAHVVYVPIPDGPPVTNNPDPTHCAGSATAPSAASGYLCVYEGFNGNLSSAGIAKVDNTGGADRSGAVLPFFGTGESTIAIGSWAVTG